MKKRNVDHITSIISLAIFVIPLLVPFSFCSLNKSETQQLNYTGLIVSDMNKTIYKSIYIRDNSYWVDICNGTELHPYTNHESCQKAILTEGVKSKVLLNQTYLELNGQDLTIVQEKTLSEGVFCFDSFISMKRLIFYIVVIIIVLFILNKSFLQIIRKI